MDSKKHLIIGAGPAGIAAAIAMGDKGLLLERQTEMGGLSRSIVMEGAVFDLGGHSFHTPHEHVRSLVSEALDMYSQKREARCLTHGSLIPYPFQKHYTEIPDAAVVAECAEGLKETDGGKGAANFEEFIKGRFGPGIAKHFMLPYNRKLWGRDLTRLTADWVGERVAAPAGVVEKFTLTGGKRKPLQADTRVAYPAKGGFGEIFRALAAKVEHTQFNADVTHINPETRRVTLADGQVMDYDNLISTMPLPLLLERVEGVPKELIDAAARLDCLHLKVVMVAVNHPVNTDIHRVYSADDHNPAHKIAINHNSSDYLRGLPQNGIMGEISYSPDKVFKRDDLEAWFVDSLLDMGLIGDRSKVLKTGLIDVKYGYPVPTHDREAIVSEIKGWLNQRDIHTLGRFGEWAYINSDEALNRGLVLGAELT